MAGKSIKYTKNLKYLGVIFDSKLTWIHHLNSIQDKINSLQHKIYRISRATWGLNPRVKKEIHNKVTEKIISYGHEIWYQDKTKQNIKILKLQRSGLLNITKCYKTVSTDALQVLAGIPPLDLKLKFSSILFRLKIGNQPATIQNFLIQPQSFNYKKPIIPPWTKTAFSWNYDINFIKKEIVAAWQDRWSNSSKGREVFTLFPEVKISRIQGDFLINQLITGHGCLGVYQERFFGVSGTCPCGHPSEDRIHLIFDCPQWNNYREKSFPRNHLEVKIELLLVVLPC
ncbi:putative 115 kDa protein in type-1 retrotransposable element R1DM [Caerostris darwini]|uniref:115 kDa protein in type-1 retrotransposable element R1DM n=1 Tax=Caerostris darwini TaxID=1538125 RepID=A0AAV4N7I3_9ARAC|nr:putative 115 kDa protein in type-1 retrotransposable element R1DM [Caerostris darwini]